MVNKNKRAKTQAPAKAAGSPLWNHRLFPPVFFLALSLLYFYEFPCRTRSSLAWTWARTTTRARP